jgi:ectoine hydroxylase-related dioxygenase (phytanoyl-CoA dioxygenase family)
MGIERPHVPLVCNSMWALTDVTEENGATRIVPGSHRWSQRPIYGAEHPSIAAEMKRGSVLIWNGSLWHGGGANRSAKRRVGIAMNYCCRIHPAAGESAARHSAGHRPAVPAAAAAPRWLRHLQASDWAHRRRARVSACSASTMRSAPCGMSSTFAPPGNSVPRCPARGSSQRRSCVAATPE